MENKGSERIDYTSNGGVIYTQNASNLTRSINADQVFGESLQHQRQHAESYAETTSQQYQESIATATNLGSSLAYHLAHADNSSEGISTREAYDAQQSVRHMESSADNWGRQFGLSSKQSIDFAIAGALGGELGVSALLKGVVGVGVNGSVRGSENYNLGADESKFMSSALNFAQSQEFQSSFQQVKDYASTQGASSSMDEGSRLSQEFTNSVNTVNTSQEAYQVAKTHLDQLSDTSAWYEQNSHLIKENLNQNYVDWAVNKFNEQHQDGTGFDRFKNMMNSSDPSDIYQSQSLVYEFVQSQIDNNIGISTPFGYQDPSVAYGNATVSKINDNDERNEIY